MHVRSSRAAYLSTALLDDVRVAYGKGTKPTPLHDYATVGVRDNVLVITAYEPEVRMGRKAIDMPVAQVH